MELLISLRKRWKMPDTAWKVWEREVASAFGSRRSGPLGHNVPDVETTLFSIECKLQKKLSFHKDHVLQAQRNKTRPFWLLAYKERQSNNRFIVMEFDDMAYINGEYLARKF